MSSKMGMVDRSYLLEERLGEGAMGTVYRTRQLVNGQIVALKLVPRQLSTGDELSEELEVQYRLALAREFQTLASLHHPNVIRVLNYGFDQEYGPYYIMELLESPLTPLEASIGKTEEERIRLIAQLLRALAYIHQRGVIHRDIKPSNVLVVSEELKLLDFGISIDKFERADFAGTAEYMAPELLRGGQPSITSDLYAVALLFHHMLTGSLPADVPSMGQVLSALLDEDSIPPAPESQAMEDRLSAILAGGLDGDTEPPPAPLELSPGIAPPIRAILSKMLAPEPQDRYETANDVLRDLAAAVSFELPVETVATRESFLRGNVLVGRGEELAVLASALEQAKQGTGGAFLLGGESGVGKSRIIAELRTLALVHGCWVAEGQSVAEGGRYYQEWLPLLRALCFRTELSDSEASVLKDLIPDIGGLLGRAIEDPLMVKPEEAQARITQTVIKLLRHLHKPLVLILEDLHWGQSETPALLVQISKTISNLPLLLVGTFRSDENPNLPQSLPDMRLIPLLRLDERNIARLSESMLGTIGQRPELVSYLLRQTEGNVFFLVETVRALAENAGELQRIGQGELPEQVLSVGIERIIERRVDRVPAEFRPVLDFAATMGRKLNLKVLERVFPDISLRTFLIVSANAAVLESQGSDWRFAHDKLRETIQHQLGGDKRKQLHLQVADTLEELYSEKEREPLSGVLAYHYKEAGVLDKACQYCVKAGDVATRLYVYAQARIHYAEAEVLLNALPDSLERRRERVNLLIKQIQCSLMHVPPAINQGRIVQVRTLMKSLKEDNAEQLTDRLLAARLDYHEARLLTYAGKVVQGMSFFEKVLPIAQEYGDQELLFDSSIQFSFTLLAKGSFDKAESILWPLLAQLKQRYGQSLEAIRAHLMYAIVVSGMGRYQLGKPIVEEMLSLVRQNTQVSLQIYFYATYLMFYLVAGDWPGVITASRSAFEMSLDSMEAITRVVCLDICAWAYSHLGMHQTAASYRSQTTALRLSMGGGASKDFYDAGEAEMHLNAGRTKEALELAKKTALTYQPHGLLLSTPVAERVWGCALARLGADSAEANIHFKNSIDAADAGGKVPQALQTELWWGRICRERGELAEAAVHFARARDRFTDEMAPYAREEALRIIAGEPPVPEGQEFIDQRLPSAKNPR